MEKPNGEIRGQLLEVESCPQLAELFIYLFERLERRREIDPPAATLFPKWLPLLGLGQVKARKEPATPARSPCEL